MKRLLLILAITIASALLTAAADTIPSPTGEVRLMSYNIRRGMGMDRKMNLNRQIDIMRQWSPDFIMIQEVDKHCLRSRSINEPKVIARALGMHATYAPTIRILWNKYGVALISREKPLRVKRYPLRCKSENRVLLVCEFEDRVVACTHLSTRQEENGRLVEIINAAARKATKPFFIGGDWNDVPDSELLDSLRKTFTILSDDYAPTFPADTPKTCIDYIAVFKSKDGPQPEVTFQSVADEPQASDHRPLIVDVKSGVKDDDNENEAGANP